jgi:hypothetical protein
MKNKMKRLFDNILTVLKAIWLLIVALTIGILTWWPIITIGIIVAGLVAFLSVTAAWVIFGIVFSFVLLVLLAQLFNPRVL